MSSNRKRPDEGLHRDEAGTVDAEGFIAPSIGLVEHALYFTSAPDVLAKTRQVIDEARLTLPGAVVVWDETIGRRKGAKAVAGSWWAGNGSVTLSFVFPAGAGVDAGAEASVQAVAAATLDAIASFKPRIAATYDGADRFLLDGRKLGMLAGEKHRGCEIFVLRLNANTDFAKAPAAVQADSSRLIDFIDAATLPLQSPGTLANTLILRLMERVPARLGFR